MAAQCTAVAASRVQAVTVATRRVAAAHKPAQRATCRPSPRRQRLSATVSATAAPSTPSTPATPATPESQDTPATVSATAAPATPTPSTPSTPATPATPESQATPATASAAAVPATPTPSSPAAAATSATPAKPTAPTTPFAAVQNEAQLFALLKAGAAGGTVPPRIIEAFHELYGNYKAAVLGGKSPGADEDFVARVMASVCERVLLELNPATAYTFPSFHLKIEEPYNYYLFGQRYIRGLVDFQRSVLGRADLFQKVQEQLEAGENVVLIANHQSEADPAVFALLLEKTFPKLAQEVIYVAGDRVVTDALCKPFSMGRNLFCVHSKKHIDDVPELKAEKQAMNRRTLRAMQTALNEGGRLLWIAPSGGRDRSICPVYDEFMPDAFDPSAVELMRALTAKAKPAAHIYPFAMYSYGVMPPPRVVEKAIGEKRIIGFSPVGIALCPELDVGAIVEGIEDKDAKQKALSDAAHAQVLAQYDRMREAIREPTARGEGTEFTQPWLAFPPVKLV
ncbi:hypothetical protein D9Q98_003072 [Chlorella vulgaris]|uniref:glycerol-3-phosphate 1-O-acyltransferase n=1 Tax=Chlorella vulgaris TaxID=3077 RepID=A0A9D4TUR1_CHLVU|nr:hypothetical protein D9Q98_003072 [Chlorella vulgaris]